MLLHQVQWDERHRSGQVCSRGGILLLVRLHATMNVLLWLWLRRSIRCIILLLQCGIYGWRSLVLHGVAVRLVGLGLGVEVGSRHIKGCAGGARWIIAAAAVVVVGVCVAQRVRCHCLLRDLVGATLLSGCEVVQRGLLLLLLLLIRSVGGGLLLLLCLLLGCCRCRGCILLLVILVLASLAELVRAKTAPEDHLGRLGLLMVMAVMVVVVGVRTVRLDRLRVAAAVMVVVMEVVATVLQVMMMRVVQVMMALRGSDTSCAAILRRWWLMLLL